MQIPLRTKEINSDIPFPKAVPKEPTEDRWYFLHLDAKENGLAVFTNDYALVITARP